MNIFALLSLLVLPFYIFLAWYVYKLDPKSRLNRIFIFLALSFSIWAFTFAFFYTAPDKSTAWFWYNLSAIGRLFYPALTLDLVLIFTENKFNNIKWYNSILLYILPLIFLYQIFTGPFITQDLILTNGQWFEVLITTDIWWYAYNAYVLIYIAMSFLIIGWWGYHSKYLREKKQATVIIVTGLTAFILGLITNEFFQYLNLLTLPSMAQVFGIIFFTGIAYAIAKYKLLKLTTSIAAEQIISKVTDLVILIDPFGTINSTNSRARRLLGYSKSELEGKNWQFLVKDPAERVELGKYISNDKIQEDHEYKTMEINLKTKRGNYLPTNSFLSVIKDDFGVIGMFLVGQDLRQTRKLQEEIQEKNKAQKVAKANEEKLKKSLVEKELLLREIHHRVKNNMQIISSLLNLQAGYLKDQNAISALKESQVRIMSMAMIHENLYRSDNLTGIEFKEYANHMIKNLFHTYNINMEKIKVNLVASDIYLNIDTAMPCGLIINELVTNSIKHAFPEDKTGTILIQMEQKDNQYYLTVSDNGTGLPPQLNIQNTETLGLMLVNSLVGQLEGNMDINREGGTTFNITFKKLEYSQRI